MSNEQPSANKMIAAVCSAVVAFATTFVVGGILWDRASRQKEARENGRRNFTGK